MDRRAFFQQLGKKIVKSGLEAVDSSVAEKQNWIRPPFAINELEFLLTCTRCTKCIEACPHNSLFSLNHADPRINHTPALDLTHKACMLCEDWPCVLACEVKALTRPEEEILPQIARCQINEDNCLPYSGPECGVCFSHCPVEGALIENLGKPEITQHCCGCAQCREACISEPKAIEVFV